MFDVIWGDPDRELVGEHRAKKELKRAQKERVKENHGEKEKKRRSHSTTRSSRSSSDSPFAFLRSHGLKRIATSDANTSTRSAVSSQVASPSLSTRSPLSPTFDLTSRPNSDIAGTRTSSNPSCLYGQSENSGANGVEEVQTFPELSMHESVFSVYEEDEAESRITIDACLGRQLPRTSMTSTVLEPQPLKIRKKENPSDMIHLTDETRSAGGANLGGSSIPESTALRTALQEQPCVQIECLVAAVPFEPSHAEACKASTQLARLNNPNMWQMLQVKSPSSCERPDVRRDAKAAVGNHNSDQMLLSALDTQHGVESWKQHVTRLDNLTDEQLLSEFTDLSLMKSCPDKHEEIELKLRLMLFWSLDHLDPIFGSTRPKMHAVIQFRQETSHLAFHETQETVAYLASSSPRCNVSHISPSPLSDKFSPNIRPFFVQDQRFKGFSNKPESFDTVSCLRLPSLCPQADIFGVLNTIALSLKPGGVLQLTLIDPLPLAATLGPHMRSWLHSNLIANLKTKQICRDPRGAFPSWLAQANLRHRGSSVTTTKFYAMPNCVSNSRARLAKESGTSVEGTYQKKLVKAEIRSHVGRLLWAEVWGPFVTASEWWWDNPICVEECIELNTIWNYYQIESRKG